ncbi:MAG: hypothetical protein HY064_09850 [Bacteroidetes bacterium]|nr:hypothetical protein [Bacteroidota bacterium]
MIYTFNKYIPADSYWDSPLYQKSFIAGFVLSLAGGGLMISGALIQRGKREINFGERWYLHPGYFRDVSDQRFFSE